MRKVLNTFLVTGLFLVVLSFFPITSTHAESLEKDHNKLFEVQTEIIMRTAPDENAEKIGKLVEGDRLRTFEEIDGWVKTFYGGEPVWVYVENLTLIEENHTSETDSADGDGQGRTEDEQKSSKKQEIKTEDETTDYIEEHKSDQKEESSIKNQTPIHVIDGEEVKALRTYKPKEVKISENTIVITKNTLDGFDIMLDPGHGGKDAGAINDSVSEKNLTLSTAKKVAEHLEQVGATVHFTRKNDSFSSLNNRVENSNTQKTDVFISLHYDYFSDPSANGINTYFYNPDTSEDLAKKVHTALADNLDMTDRGIKNEAYYVLKHNNQPAVLLELGFITNPADLEKMQTEEYQETVAKAITEGLLEYVDEASVE